jgi:hypothetical protein
LFRQETEIIIMNLSKILAFDAGCDALYMAWASLHLAVWSSHHILKEIASDIWSIGWTWEHANTASTDNSTVQSRIETAHRIHTPMLLNDMSAFKAANPGAVFQDFIA